MTETDADLVFFPWIRRGASAALLTPDTNGPDMPGLTTATASVEINSNAARTASTPVTVMGPGHVTGLDRRQIVRMDPAPGAVAFESNYFPLIELDEPALPWLFTPAGASAQGTSAALVVPRGRAPAGRRTAGSAAVRGPGRAADRWTGEARRRAARPDRQLGLGPRPADSEDERRPRRDPRLGPGAVGGAARLPAGDAARHQLPGVRRTHLRAGAEGRARGRHHHRGRGEARAGVEARWLVGRASRLPLVDVLDRSWR